jgi:hypothetical protein
MTSPPPPNWRQLILKPVAFSISWLCCTQRHGFIMS